MPPAPGTAPSHSSQREEVPPVRIAMLTKVASHNAAPKGRPGAQERPCCSRARHSRLQRAKPQSHGLTSDQTSLLLSCTLLGAGLRPIDHATAVVFDKSKRLGPQSIEHGMKQHGTSGGPGRLVCRRESAQGSGAQQYSRFHYGDRTLRTLRTLHTGCKAVSLSLKPVHGSAQPL